LRALRGWDRRSALLLLTVILVSSHAFALDRYSGRGLVLAVDAKTITISHDRIPGFMEAMVMRFDVRIPKLLQGIQPGQQVYFRLVVDKKESYIDHLVLLSAEPVDPGKWQTPVVSKLVKVGERVPDFTLKDHNERSISLSQFQGKIVAVTFIYTRCPLPDYCPRMTDNFAELKKRFADEEGLVLLTITIDPQYDTPQILNEYARLFGGGESRNWHYLTGSKQDIIRVAGYFGLEYWPDNGTILHNLQTAVIDRSGKMAANLEGKEYSAKQLGDLIERLRGQ
jgi:protein SCO1/2